MATLVLNASECDLVELDILNNVQFNGLLKTTISSKIDENKMIISIQEMGSLTSIRQLIKNNFFNLDKIKALLENIDSCQTELRDHLLRTTQIDFNQDYIFYNEQTQRYQFLYNPCKSNLSNDMERYLIQDLLIHANAPSHLDHLYQGSYCVLTLINSLSTNVPKKSFFDFIPIISNKKIKGEPKQQPIIKNQTISLTQKASLISKENHNEIIRLPFSVNSVGRGSHCNVYINSPTLSTEHAIISLIQGKYFIKDNQSKNGTFVNSLKVENSTALSSGNIIKFGEKEFIFIL